MGKLIEGLPMNTNNFVNEAKYKKAVKPSSSIADNLASVILADL